MLRTLQAIIAAAALIAATTVCSDPAATHNTVPKPDAWPRLEPYPAAYSRSINGFAVNDSAMIEQGDGNGWYTLRYPRYHAILYLTFSQPGRRLDAALANRLERMALNAGDAAGSMTEISGESGFTGRIFNAPAAAVTPLQFVAWSIDGRMVSGALHFPDIRSNPPVDSLRPTVDAVERDVVHALSRL